MYPILLLFQSHSPEGLFANYCIDIIFPVPLPHCVHVYPPLADFFLFNRSGPTRSMIQPKASSAHGTTRSQSGT
jgi:hypothetical protein